MEHDDTVIRFHEVEQMYRPEVSACCSFLCGDCPLVSAEVCCAEPQGNIRRHGALGGAALLRFEERKVRCCHLFKGREGLQRCCRFLFRERSAVEVLGTRVASFFHEGNSVAHGGVVADEDGFPLPKEFICFLYCSFHLGGVIAVLHFDHVPSARCGDGGEISGNGLRWHARELAIVKIAMHDEVIQLEVRSETECLLYLSFLAVAVCEKHIHDARLLLMLEPEGSADRVTHSFPKRSRAERNVSHTCFYVAGEPVWCSECMDDVLGAA